MSSNAIIINEPRVFKTNIKSLVNLIIIIIIIIIITIKLLLNIIFTVHMPQRQCEKKVTEGSWLHFLQ